MVEWLELQGDEDALPLEGHPVATGENRSIFTNHASRAALLVNLLGGVGPRAVERKR
jgi:hypothetical protein